MNTDHMRRQGARIREARIAKELSQAELARRIGLKTPTSMWRYEDGRTKVPDDKLARIAHEVGKSVSDLLGEEPHSDGADTPYVRADIQAIAIASVEFLASETPETRARLDRAIAAHLKRLGR